MVQGTSSNAGKSVLCAALCRMLLQDGYRVAPFKAQNMSLNSCVTPDGLEMGRAQAVQARACRLEPDVRMNPVLLKPMSETGSQVILLGKPHRRMAAREYMRKKEDLRPAIHNAYDSLAAENQVMVLEGAGSPAEINLKPYDVVNMSMASYAEAKVLLVGDIDRGGVFASLVGTMELLDPWERELVLGFVLNRFRGDQSLLDPALTYTTARTGKPFYGVVPYLPDLGLPEEDSVSFKEVSIQSSPATVGASAHASGDASGVDIALIDLPTISNFTDFDALKGEPDLRLRVVRRLDDLGQPDAILLPGSRNTVADLQYLRDTGLAARLLELASLEPATTGGCEIVGICAGFQMLGESLDDPDAVESSRASVPGLGLLPLRTEFLPEKTLTRVQGRHQASGLPIIGYEIHHGRCHIHPNHTLQPAITSQDNHALGYASQNGLVWGAYTHGLFDADLFRRWWIDRLRQRKGLAPLTDIQFSYSLEPALDRLADVVRSCLDWKSLYRAAGLE